MCGIDIPARLGKSTARFRMNWFRIIIVCLPYALSAPAVQAWLDEEYGHIAHDEQLAGILHDFAGSVSVPAIISPNIRASVSGNFPVSKAVDFLSDLAKTYDLSWVYDGTTLYVYDGAEVEEKTLDLPYRLATKFQAQVEALAVKGVPLTWKIIPSQNIVTTSGPPRFVELIGEIVGRTTREDALAQSVEASRDDYVVRVFPIRYGYVDEEAHDASGGNMDVLNLAELLGNIMNVAHVSNVIRSGEQADSRNRNGKLRGTGLVASDAPGQTGQTTPPELTAGLRKSEPYIIGEPRLNAIIVRDREERMPVYEKLIEQLDKPLSQIEIEVTILDISASEAEQLGFDWQSNVTTDEFDIYFNAALELEAAREIIVRVTAQQQDGNSRVLARPSVLTLDNHEALFQNNRTFYVRLGTERSDAVDLVPVSYGITMRVRPHIIYEGDIRKIQLSIHLEDGSRSSGAPVTEVPEVSQSVIQTQAVIREEQSLLLGGYKVYERILKERRIPLLGHVPVLRYFFSYSNNQESFYDRYFVITPRIVDTSIDYEINTGFEDSKLSAIKPKQPVAENTR